MVQKIFLTGATGYIGGSVFHALQKRTGEFEITILVRSEEKGKDFASLGAKIVVGSWTDYDVLVKAASEADIVIHTADTFLLEPAIAITEGLRKRRATTGKAPIFIQTSGSAVLVDGADGLKAGETSLSDLDTEGINKIPLTAPHRPLDVYISRFPQDIVRTAVIIPPNIYGVREGLGNVQSQITPGLIRAAINNKAVHVVGKGLNKWIEVHIDDIATAYTVLVDRLVDGTASTGEEGIYFIENGHNSMEDIGKAIATALKKRGAIEDEKVTPFPKELELNPVVFGGNSLGTADKLRKLGWKPVHKDLLPTIDAEVELILKNSK